MKDSQLVYCTRVVPADGVQAFLNIFRKWLGWPIATNVVYGLHFPTPIVLQPGESLDVVFTMPDETHPYMENCHCSSCRKLESTVK